MAQENGPAAHAGQDHRAQALPRDRAAFTGAASGVDTPDLSRADQINEAHRIARKNAETAVNYAIRCGQLLEQAKDELPHGQFESWVQKHCEFSPRTARLYMQAAKQNGNALPFSSLRQFLGIESPPKAKADTPKGAVPVLKDPEPVPESTGETAAEPPAASVSAVPAEKSPTVTAPPAFDFEGYEVEDDEDYRARIETVMAADDKLGAMREQLAAAQREVAGLKASRDHYQYEAGEAVRIVKARDRQIDKLERELKKVRAENESLRERVSIMEGA